jgi:hypothetical protein
VLDLNAGTAGEANPKITDAGSEADHPDGASGGSGGTKDAGDGAAALGGTDAGDASAGTGGSAGAGCVPAPEICDNGSDDDCDQKADCDDDDCAFQVCAPDSECNAGACVSVYLNATVACGNSGQTGTALCQAAGWQGCTDSIGYWWWQCAGPGDCPSAWSALSCSTYASGTDCVGKPLDSTEFHTAQNGCDGAYGATDYGYDCSSYNPGYNVRLSCF